jgi:8-oxo-dGTP pyrophosphatase MutT (NUDIX family)
MPSAPATPTHAGGLVYRMRGGEPEFLVVTARRNPQDWIYPKGHIERGESPEEAALREVREEAGLDARIVSPIEDVAITVAGERQVIRYFLMLAGGEASPGENRRAQWVTADEGMRVLRHAETKTSLRKALDAMRTHGSAD